VGFFFRGKPHQRFGETGEAHRQGDILTILTWCLYEPKTTRHFVAEIGFSVFDIESS